MEAKLFDGYVVKSISKDAYDEFRAQHEPSIFPNRFDVNVSDALTETERLAAAELDKNLGTPFDLRLGFYDGKKMIGWHYGKQVDAETFRMVTSGILPEYQCKGIYSRSLAPILEEVRRAGFQTVLSRHYATDNGVIVPKLKFGFLVSGFELTDQFGLLLRLSYYFNETRRKILHMRSGLQQPDENVTSLIRRY